jgi:predicted RNA-binding Zn ribbon-like protein
VQPVIDKADKTLGFTTAAEGVDAILGHYLCAMLGALADGTWGRLKACWNEECRRAFYDRSRNHAGTWCEMATCGSVHKMRRHRARKRAASAPRATRRR